MIFNKEMINFIDFNCKISKYNLLKTISNRSHWSNLINLNKFTPSISQY